MSLATFNRRRVCLAFMLGIPAFFLLGFRCLAAGQGEHAADEPKIEFVARSTSGRTEFRQLEPIEITAKGVNKGDQTQYLSPALSAYERVRIEVFQNGEVVPLTRYGELRKTSYLRGWSTKSWIPLWPLERLEYKLVPNLIYDMTKPGEYSIVIGLYYVHEKGKPVVWKTLRAEPIKVKVIMLNGE